jgi:mannan endo-1,4-beta-mannosidase
MRIGVLSSSLLTMERLASLVKNAPLAVELRARRGGKMRLVARCATVAGLVCATILLVHSTTGSASTDTDGFVRSSGTTLTLEGHPWRFVGFNDYQLTSMPGGSSYYCGRHIDDAMLNAVLRDAKKSGATAIRTWFFQSYYDLNAQGAVTAPTWAAFNRVLDEAAEYGLKVIPVLVNEWQDCGPPSTNKDLGFYTSGYTQSNSYGYPLSFKSYATTVVQHYAKKTQIAFWQIGNELENYTTTGCDSSAENAGATAIRAFADDMTSAIKAVDPNHLVSLGTGGGGQCGLSTTDYQYVHAGRIDLCDYHDYYNVTQAMPNDGYNRLAQRIAQCKVLNKPIVVTESGIAADVDTNGNNTGTVTNTTLQNRAGFFLAKMNAAFSSGVAGYVLWEKEQDASNSAENINNHALFEIGPSTLYNDPTNTVTAKVAGSLRG